MWRLDWHYYLRLVILSLYLQFFHQMQQEAAKHQSLLMYDLHWYFDSQPDVELRSCDFVNSLSQSGVLIFVCFIDLNTFSSPQQLDNFKCPLQDASHRGDAPSSSSAWFTSTPIVSRRTFTTALCPLKLAYNFVLGYFFDNIYVMHL